MYAFCQCSLPKRRKPNGQGVGFQPGRPLTARADVRCFQTQTFCHRVTDTQGPGDKLLVVVLLYAVDGRLPNVVAVALANKNARIVWSILSGGTEYQPAV